MRVKLEYGKSGLEVELPDERVVRSLAYKDAAPLPHPESAFLQVLQQPTGTPPFAELVKGRRDACILICDITRPVPNELMLRRPLKFVAGDMEEAFYEGVDFVRGVVRDTVDEPVDIVVTSGAGYPLDTTFYQSVKGMTGALQIVKPGGTIVLAASLTEGIGSPEFESLFQEHASLELFVERILDKSYFVMDQWQLEELAKVCRKAKVKLVSDGLPAETINRLFVQSAPSVEVAVQESLEEYGPDATIAVIPKGPYVLAEVA